jgi:hypothetical protein
MGQGHTISKLYQQAVSVKAKRHCKLHWHQHCTNTLLHMSGGRYLVAAARCSWETN